MADQRQRIPLQTSFSFSGTSTCDSTRSAKRRLTNSASDPAYFTPSSIFHPRLYHSQPAQEAPLSKESSPPTTCTPPTSQTNLTTRNHPLGVNGEKVMDPTPSDPGAVFIHPPFADFPDAYKYKDGLTYNLMAANPEWFLDPVDFISPVNNNPDAIRYPSQLEPPRGWCPTKKKDLKDGWAEGEEPRLRCTFCRRTYAGVNAKSMWRRHVYEKHKIAMSNRRDTQDRKGGRGSNKENKDGSHSNGRGGRRSSHDVERLTYKLHLSRSGTIEYTHPSISGAGPSRRHEEVDEDEEPADHSFPSSVRGAHAGLGGEPDLFRAIKSSSTPPLTPGASPSKSSQHLRDITLESPYDPLLTPSFRHSPPRLPSDQPWRFPSPSHPLHSKAQELSLCMLMRGEASPVVSGLDVSPVVIVPAMERGKRSIFSSPLAGPIEKDKEIKSFPVPSPDVYFKMVLLLYLSLNAPPFKGFKIPESPFGRPSQSPLKHSHTSLTEAIQSWQSDVPFSPAKPSNSATSLLGPIELQGEDPFSDGLYTTWVNLSATTDGSSQKQDTPTSRIVEESPVVRSNIKNPAQTTRGSSGLSSLGAGLMDAFLSGKGRPQSPTESSDDDEYLGRKFVDSPIHVGKKTQRERRGWLRGRDGDAEMTEAQPKKRRKTISDRN